MPSTPPPEERIQALLSKHCETLRAQVDEVERLASLIAHHGKDEDTLTALIQTAHRIAGSGGSMGFDLLSQKAFALETFATQWMHNRQRYETDACGMIRALTHALANAGANLTPQQSRLRQSPLLSEISSRRVRDDQTR